MENGLMENSKELEITHGEMAKVIMASTRME